MPVLVPTLSWVDVYKDFILGLPKIRRNKDLSFVVVDIFFKMAHFMAYNHTNDTTHIAELYFKKVMMLHGVPMFIVS